MSNLGLISLYFWVQISWKNIVPRILKETWIQILFYGWFVFQAERVTLSTYYNIVNRSRGAQLKSHVGSIFFGKSEGQNWCVYPFTGCFYRRNKLNARNFRYCGPCVAREREEKWIFLLLNILPRLQCGLRDCFYILMWPLSHAAHMSIWVWDPLINVCFETQRILKVVFLWTRWHDRVQISQHTPVYG